jgi:hypothetical protein
MQQNFFSGTSVVTATAGLLRQLAKRRRQRSRFHCASTLSTSAPCSGAHKGLVTRHHKSSTLATLLLQQPGAENGAPAEAG